MSWSAIWRVCSGVSRCLVSGTSSPFTRARNTSPALMCRSDAPRWTAALRISIMLDVRYGVLGLAAGRRGAPRSGPPSMLPLRHSRSPAYNLSVPRLLVDQVQQRSARQVAREVLLDQRDLA